ARPHLAVQAQVLLARLGSHLVGEPEPLGTGRAHPFVPPAVMPSTRKRCENRKMMSTGATDSSVASASVGSSMTVDVAVVGLNCGTFASMFARPTCTGTFWPPTMRNGRK